MVQAKRAFRIRLQVLAAAAGSLTLLGAILAFAFTTFQNDVDGVPIPSRWANASFTWVLNNPGTPPANVDTTDGTNPQPLKTVLINSFNSWATASLNGQQLTNLTVTNGSDVTNLPNPQIDCTNVISFNDNNAADFPTGTTAIVFTTVTTDYLLNGAPGTPGTIYTFPECNGLETIKTTSPSIVYDADIVFNPHAQFSTSTPPLASDFDLQSVATREIGHALGLDNSGVVHAVMFPFGDASGSQQRTLSTDDLIGISFLYPSSNFASYMGTISGQVRFPTIAGIYAAHVVAMDASTGNVVLDALTNSDGGYNLYVPPGSYNVLVLPLAPDDNHGIYSLPDFSGWTCGYDEGAPPCCDTSKGQCLGLPLTNPTNFTGKFF
ncbi:MAG: matrixin family metalloprotease [Terriglobia bacterium]